MVIIDSQNLTDEFYALVLFSFNYLIVSFVRIEEILHGPATVLSPSHGKRLLLLLSRFSRVRLCATPQTAAHQAPLSLGFSRQEHWSGLPFPSPMHESESEVTQYVQLFATQWTATYQAPPSLGFSRQEYRSGLPLPSPYGKRNQFNSCL